MNWIIGIAYAVVGFVLVYWATPLSLRYNAWTTGVRQRHPNFNPPPTPEWRQTNTKIMTVLFRVVGASLLVFSVLYLLPMIVGNSPR
jgi:uncharacterized membrane protein YjgN (DUF898 family)